MIILIVKEAFQYIQNRMSSPYVMFIVVLTVVLVLTPGSNASCSDIHPDINLTTVATMCTDSVVTGRNVYIDTSQASNMSLTSGSICKCQAELTEGTFNVTANFTGHTDSIGCGSYLNFQDKVFDHNVSCETNFDSVFQNITNITVSYHAVSESVTGDFCVHLQQNICTDNEFQCTDGTCIPYDLRCNNLPECPDDSDEKNCSISCHEGQWPCDDRSKCIPPDYRCDGKEDCPDGSDELSKYCVNGTETNDTSSTPEKSFITVTCHKLRQISTTTPAATTRPSTASVATQPPPPTTPSTTSPASTATPVGTTSETPSTAPPPSVTTTPHTESTQTATDPSDTSLDDIEIVGIVLGVILFIALVVGVSVILHRKGICATIGKYAVEKMHRQHLGDEHGKVENNTHVEMTNI